MKEQFISSRRIRIMTIGSGLAKICVPNPSLAPPQAVDRTAALVRTDAQSDPAFTPQKSAAAALGDLGIGSGVRVSSSPTPSAPLPRLLSRLALGAGAGLIVGGVLLGGAGLLFGGCRLSTGGIPGTGGGLPGDAGTTD